MYHASSAVHSLLLEEDVFPATWSWLSFEGRFFFNSFLASRSFKDFLFHRENTCIHEHGQQRSRFFLCTKLSTVCSLLLKADVFPSTWSWLPFEDRFFLASHYFWSSFTFSLPQKFMTQCIESNVVQSGHFSIKKSLILFKANTFQRRAIFPNLESSSTVGLMANVEQSQTSEAPKLSAEHECPGWPEAEKRSSAWSRNAWAMPGWPELVHYCSIPWPSPLEDFRYFSCNSKEWKKEFNASAYMH